MNIFKKSIFILFVSVLGLFLIGCNSEVNKNTISKEVLDYREIPTEDIIRNSVDKIKKVVSNFDYAEIGELNAYEDPLLMELRKNKKKYNNITIELILTLSKDVDLKDTDRVIEDYTNAIIEEFQHGGEGHLRISNIGINYRREGWTGKPMGGKGRNYSTSHVGEELENLKLDQDEEDFKAQSLVYNYLERDEEIYLTRIGIEDNSFTIELQVFEYQEDGEYDLKIGPISDDLAKLILEDDEVQSYLIDKSVEDVNIYWNMMWYDRSELPEYSYKIKGR